jgi:hypothetical protein
MKIKTLEFITSTTEQIDEAINDFLGSKECVKLHDIKVNDYEHTGKIGTILVQKYTIIYE